MPHQQNLPASPPMSPQQPQQEQIIPQLSDFLSPVDPVHESGEGRVMILCFDGTGNQFGTHNSNVVRFIRALQKDDRKKQTVYYQPGIGSYNKYDTYVTHAGNTVESAVDVAIALTLNAHVKEGYQFIAQNHRPGDKICLFGFSRGAHAARVLAGMVYKVGLLPKANMQQLDFAFSIYNTAGYDGYKRSLEFKRTFTHHYQVSVDFVGVWDSVVGLVPKAYPYTSVNYAMKKFRHALSLDERRAAFRPNLWSELTPTSEHELDVDMPVPDTDKLNRGDFEYKPPERNFADVKEVWFAGTHADVGGGSHIATRSSSLSFISLRWMIKECILSETGIMFDLKYLKDDLNFDFDGLIKEIGNETKKQNRIMQYHELKEYRDAQLKEREAKDTTNGTAHIDAKLEEISNKTEKQNRIMKVRDAKQDTLPLPMQQRCGHAWDILADIFDQLVIFWYFWWMLEVVPMLYTYQDHHGNWIRRRMCNFGRGRYIPIYKDKVLVHRSVETRIHKTRKEGEKQSEDGTRAKKSRFFDILQDRLGFRNGEEYTPRAYNWDYLQEQDVIKYVD
ncbi:hypothetical protein M378DRAFT_923486 [Amanita muscaria Koide BX008]|uniref:T6SS Phospholipase effector Tle1-like catalytic domain-containing protein n=1 Tax=Amanita muscaria (strain Koide BX008) TaxID=946122 RepID=A0A0C2WUC9_AMAMK|nr:hypothetical protein M378DRAFT_923486 [Amanita muscaria Koide BX008]